MATNIFKPTELHITRMHGLSARKKWIQIQKQALALVFCTAYRLIRLVPNNDPIMGFALPFARQNPAWQAALFPFAAMVLFDAVTNRLGIWTAVTAITYGLIGLGFSVYLKRKTEVRLRTYAGSAVVGILFFDAVTGPLATTFIFRVPFEAALIGQVPFTVAHLFSGVLLTLLIAPIIDPALQQHSVLRWLRTKAPFALFKAKKSGQ